MSQATPQKLDLEMQIAALREMGNFSDEEILRIFEMVQKGASVAEIAGVSKDTIESGYAMAYALYSARKYDEAKVFFQTLCIYDGDTARNWIGLGLCFDKEKEYVQAARAFAKAADLQQSQYPKALYLVSQCCYKMQDVEAAKLLAEKAVAAGATDAESESYRKLARNFLASV